jgi:hypothetical protein
MIQHAKRPESKAFLGDERCAGVKPQVRFILDERIVAETADPRVYPARSAEIGAENGVRAESDVTRCFLEVEAVSGLEPLPVFVDQSR